jgi:hypothetical protein
VLGVDQATVSRGEEGASNMQMHNTSIHTPIHDLRYRLSPALRREIVERVAASCRKLSPLKRTKQVASSATSH